MRLPPLVYLLGLVSFLMDVASEMVYPLLPLFLASLGAGAGTIGLVEGVAEATASLFKVVGGRISDRMGQRKPLLLLGYGLPALLRPILALALNPMHVLLYRFLDRLGKGLRTAPRDALLAEAVDRGALGRAYGLHRGLDTLGATVGPFLAFLLLPHVGVRGVFWLSAIPALLAVTALLWVREARVEKEVREAVDPPSPLRLAYLRTLPGAYRRFLLVSGIFALALSSNAFLLLRLKELGLPQEEVTLAYTGYNLLYALLSYPMGGLADRVGLRRVVALGFALYALVYLGFAWAQTAFWGVALLLLYALYSAAFEGASRAYLATLVPREAKATAIGLYHTVVGVLLLPASLLFGLLWQHLGPGIAFSTGAGLALLALGLFLTEAPLKKP
ncbi:MFS transporter [Thermus sp.]|uniref:MFS transporter n=1 Tax=Thermus sp. TaxID=275 RepID=UPI00391D68D4